MYTEKEIKEMELQYNIKWMKPADDEEMAFQELERVGDFLNGLRPAFYNSGYNDSLVIEGCRKAVNDINAACDKFISTIRQEDPEDQDSPDQQANDKNVEPPKRQTLDNTDPEDQEGGEA